MPIQLWILDLIAHFILYYFLLAGVLLLITIAIKSYKPALLAICLMSINGYQLLPFYQNSQVSQQIEHEPIKLIVSNVLSSNRSPQALLTLIAQESPDIVILLEINARWLSQLQSLSDTFPYTLSEPDKIILVWHV